MTKIYTVKEIDDLIKSYKKTADEKVSLEIYKAFEGFILKYAHFLKYGTIKNNDRDLMSLARILDIKDLSNNHVKNMFETWELYDIFNELYYLFLMSISRFVKIKNGPYFSGYLYNYYKYLVHQWIRSIKGDIMNNSNPISMENLPELEGEAEINAIEYENICLTEKTSLNQFEKYILYLSYGKKLTETEIAELLSVSRLHIHQVKNKARKKLITSGMLLEDFKIEK